MLPPLTLQQEFILRLREVQSVSLLHKAAFEKAELVFNALLSRFFGEAV